MRPNHANKHKNSQLLDDGTKMTCSPVVIKFIITALYVIIHIIIVINIMISCQINFSLIKITLSYSYIRSMKKVM